MNPFTQYFWLHSSTYDLSNTQKLQDPGYFSLILAFAFPYELSTVVPYMLACAYTTEYVPLLLVLHVVQITIDATVVNTVRIIIVSNFFGKILIFIH